MMKSPHQRKRLFAPLKQRQSKHGSFAEIKTAHPIGLEKFLKPFVLNLCGESAIFVNYERHRHFRQYFLLCLVALPDKLCAQNIVPSYQPPPRHLQSASVYFSREMHNDLLNVYAGMWLL